MSRPEIESGPPTVGFEHSSKELLEHGVNSYSEHLHELVTVYLVL